ncbi:SHOCT domain-containing protein [Tropicibacter sp. S64]|uniref:SHOCT domain-containing protein n=1 Tax=Tropicibacter sp. S64 TaxID=3415122 RepID=UPI003C7D6E37
MKRLALVTALFAQPALAQRAEGYGYMMDGYGIGMMFGPVLWLIVIGLIVAGVIWMVRRGDITAPRAKTTSALDELDMRLARGEIDAEDYAARKKLLSS